MSLGHSSAFSSSETRRARIARRSLPISTFGGLKARGNPGGAAGVYQVVEAVLQLRGQAGENQVPDDLRAMVQCLGGPASTAATHILERTES